MTYIIIGQIIGLVSFVIFCVFFALIFGDYIESKKIKNCIIIASFIVLQISFFLLGVEEFSNSYEKFILQHKYTQELYIKGTEKYKSNSTDRKIMFELAQESNRQLAEKKIQAKRWTSIFISNEILKELMELETIK